MTLNFWRICAANFFLFASVYTLLPLLPFTVGQLAEVSIAQAGNLYLTFAIAMFMVGPFHAYLGDAYRRKSVLLYSTFVMLAAMLGYVFVDSYVHLLLLAWVQGACFGMATTAGITVAIDITTSARRSAGNKVFAWAARIGMLVGAGIGSWFYQLYGFRMTVYLAIAAGLACIYLVSRVYVAFRAPIGMSVCNLDRFLLPRAWLPAINMVLIAFVPGVLLPRLFVGGYEVLLVLLLLSLVTVLFTKMFVKLSHHCQRGTANTTCHLAMEAGVLIGLSTTCHFLPDASSLTLPSSLEWMYEVAALVAVIALLFFFLLTRPYYKKMRVR